MTKHTNEKIIPAVALRDSVVFPYTEFPLTFGRPRSNNAVKSAFAGTTDRFMAVFTQKDPRIIEPGKDDLYEIGTLVAIEHLFETDGNLAVFARGVARIRLEEVVSTDPFLLVRVSEIPEIVDETEETKALSLHLVNEYRRAFNFGKSIDVKILMRLSTGVSSSELVDQIASSLEINTEEKQSLLEQSLVKERLVKVSEYLAREIKVLEIERTISSKTQEKFEKEMKEAVLRERKRTIEKELGEIDGSEDNEVKELKQKIVKLGLPSEVRKKVDKELNRFAQMPPMNPERSYIENLSRFRN